MLACHCFMKSQSSCCQSRQSRPAQRGSSQISSRHHTITEGRYSRYIPLPQMQSILPCLSRMDHPFHSTLRHAAKPVIPQIPQPYAQSSSEYSHLECLGARPFLPLPLYAYSTVRLGLRGPLLVILRQCSFQVSGESWM